ncbi:radical SAM/SPASM domain-containing protein [Halarcobacter bivalviorum]|uniref:Heme d1 biosynthesis radical SAM protein NirJ n=1 Tax=Halarcobacter bivalviorum TaxID=663364 RepID=A0AAX2A826_9BACT|nr:radical SAM protein [Halarcobacter bivalviorum]AXH12669.1 heme d1 biosynthesis radical SAM protein NirJ [Halarcobacter bivalviorum]RXK10407.1 radical SAM/SPASM domain-containing protein [Halarcobacter bivalviorum]
MFRLSELIKSTLEDIPSRGHSGSIMIWNFTNRCNLFCHHCYSKADPNNMDLLSFDEIRKTIPQLIESGIRFVIFSGGEPLIRSDIYDIAQEMKKHKIMTYLSTNGMYINEKNVEKIITTFNYIGISIDGKEEVHDYFRGQKGSYKKAIKAIKLIQKNGGNAGVRFTLTKETKDDFYSIFELVENLNVNKFYISHLVYSGRGEDNLKIDLTKEERRECVEYIIDKAFDYYNSKKGIDLVTGNMEMDSILLLKRFEKNYPRKVDDLMRRLKLWGGNNSGIRIGNMDWKGDVKPDPFFPKVIGNYLKQPFENIWSNTDDEIVNKLREIPRKISGKCENCKYISICNGGSRSRAYVIHNDLWAEDPSCYLTNEEIKA